MEARSGQNCSNKIAPQVSFFSHCFTFYELVVYFHRQYNFFLRWLLIFFSGMNYFNLVWLQFFVGTTNEFFHSYCKLFLTGTTNYFLLVVLRIIFHWHWQLFFSASWIYFLAYNTLRACHWGGLAQVFWLVRRPFWKLCRCYPKECQGETLSEKETKEVFTFCHKIWKES